MTSELVSSMHVLSVYHLIITPNYCRAGGDVCDLLISKWENNYDIGFLSGCLLDLRLTTCGELLIIARS